jgi:hypothetical protein
VDKLAQPVVLVDLDSTAAKYRGWRGHAHIGEPIPIMARRIRRWLREGKTVKIFTARVAEKDSRKRQAVVDAIQHWTKEHFGRKLPVTNVKDKNVVKIWDDRAVSVVPNKGRQTKLDFHDKHAFLAGYKEAALTPEQESGLGQAGMAALGGVAGGALGDVPGAAIGALAGLAGMIAYQRSAKPGQPAAGAPADKDPVRRQILEYLRQAYATDPTLQAASEVPSYGSVVPRAAGAAVAPYFVTRYWALPRLRTAAQTVLPAGSKAQQLLTPATGTTVWNTPLRQLAYQKIPAGRLKRALQFARLVPRVAAPVGKGLASRANPVAAAAGLGMMGGGFVHGLIDPRRFEQQATGPGYEGWGGALLGNTQDMLYRDTGSPDLIPTKAQNVLNQYGAGDAAAFATGFVPTGFWNVPGRAGAMVRRAIEDPFTGRQVPVQFTGRSAQNPRSESQALRAARALKATYGSQLTPGLGAWGKSNAQDIKDWWQGQQSDTSQAEEFLRKPVTEAGR